jgi:hypothetical protein
VPADSSIRGTQPIEMRRPKCFSQWQCRTERRHSARTRWLLRHGLTRHWSQYARPPVSVATTTKGFGGSTYAGRHSCETATAARNVAGCVRRKRWAGIQINGRTRTISCRNQQAKTNFRISKRSADRATAVRREEKIEGRSDCSWVQPEGPSQGCESTDAAVWMIV